MYKFKVLGKFYLCNKITKYLTILYNILKSFMPYFMLFPYFKEASGKLTKVLKGATKPEMCLSKSSLTQSVWLIQNETEKWFDFYI